MNHLIFLLLFLSLLNSCQKREKQSSESTEQENRSALLLIEKADSAWNKQMQHDSTFTGIHNHGKDLAVHAHQNIGKKRRVLRKGVAVRTEREGSYWKESERRRRKLVELGIVESDSTDSTDSKSD